MIRRVGGHLEQTARPTIRNARADISRPSSRNSHGSARQLVICTSRLNFFRAATHIYGANLASAVHFVSEHHAMMPLTTCPDTSVSLKSRPLYR